jgi:glycosyltransferase involved in cell wall biosynthesis
MRNLKRVVYTSSYDRGLQHLLEIWSEVKAAVPDATLDVYYGWDLFEKFYAGNPSSMAWKARMEEMLKQEGVIDHGRLPQHKLREELLRSGVWAYPAHFGEINCISAIKAQAYGCEPVVVNYAALQETVQYGKKVDGDIYDDETKQAYKKALIEALEKPMDQKKREEMCAWAQEKYAWSNIASQWSEEFKL